VRTVRALDACERWTGEKICFCMTLPCIWAERAALSVTDRRRYGAVMEPACASEFRSYWSILLTFQN
jgi:hypothetical protein